MYEDARSQKRQSDSYCVPSRDHGGTKTAPRSSAFSHLCIQTRNALCLVIVVTVPESTTKAYKKEYFQ